MFPASLWWPRNTCCTVDGKDMESSLFLKWHSLVRIDCADVPTCQSPALQLSAQSEVLPHWPPHIQPDCGWKLFKFHHHKIQGWGTFSSSDYFLILTLIWMCFIARKGEKRSLSPGFQCYQLFLCYQNDLKKPKETHKVPAVPAGAINTAQKMHFKSYWEVCHVLIKLVLYSFRKLQLPPNLKVPSCCSSLQRFLK